jgi:PPK2 family polyphosphate:nucleotide phosphotransferase
MRWVPVWGGAPHEKGGALAEQALDLKRILKESRKLAARYRITQGSSFRLKHFDPADTAEFTDEDRSRAKEALTRGVQALAHLQEKLYAQDSWALLVVFQAMDAAGKDGAIKHVMSGVNPEGCQVYSFKAPSSEELDHDFLWRCAKALPERGRIGIFNRSYYEEVLVVRVHPGLLQRQKLPPDLITKRIWKERWQDIRAFERHLARSGVAIVKFFLHLSKKEQKKRFLERLDLPEKHWKFSEGDVKEREYWKDYMNAYEDVIRRTATRYAPWYVVPADNKWFTRIIVATAIIDTLAALDLQFPELTGEKKRELARARRSLLA